MVCWNKNQTRDKLLWSDEHKVPGEKSVYNSESELTFTQLLYSEYGATVSYSFHSQSVNENKLTDWQTNVLWDPQEHDLYTTDLKAPCEV